LLCVDSSQLNQCSVGFGAGHVAGATLGFDGLPAAAHHVVADLRPAVGHWPGPAHSVVEDAGGRDHLGGGRLQAAGGGGRGGGGRLLVGLVLPAHGLVRLQDELQLLLLLVQLGDLLLQRRVLLLPVLRFPDQGIGVVHPPLATFGRGQLVPLTANAPFVSLLSRQIFVADSPPGRGRRHPEELQVAGADRDAAVVHGPAGLVAAGQRAGVRVGGDGGRHEVAAVDVVVDVAQPAAGQRRRRDDRGGDGVLVGAHRVRAGQRRSVARDVHDILGGSVVLSVRRDGPGGHRGQDVVQVLHQVGHVFAWRRYVGVHATAHTTPSTGPSRWREAAFEISSARQLLISTASGEFVLFRRQMCHESTGYAVS